jgi:hypothetical protein
MVEGWVRQLQGKSRSRGRDRALDDVDALVDEILLALPDRPVARKLRHVYRCYRRLRQRALSANLLR